MESANCVNVDTAFQGKVSSAQEVIGCFSHGRANHCPWSVSKRNLVLDEVRDMIDSLKVCQGRATELHSNVQRLIGIVGLPRNGEMILIIADSFVSVSVII